MSSFADQLAANLGKIRESQPLIHNITNLVVMNSTANVLLASGAAPVMAHAANEVEEMVACAGALVLNIGTLTDDWVEAMVIAGRKATALGIPVVLDPVGAGATSLRTAAARRILAETAISVVRGNPSEILALGQRPVKGRGVDTAHGLADVEKDARQIAESLRTVLAITGAVDLVTDGVQFARIANGHPLMPKVTGTGCAATAVIGAFLAVEADPFVAAVCGLAFFGLAGEQAGAQASGPGSFMVHLLDALYSLTPAEAARHCRISLS